MKKNILIFYPMNQVLLCRNGSGFLKTLASPVLTISIKMIKKFLLD